jgi:TRAP-type transport system periplasmic protein
MRNPSIALMTGFVGLVLSASFAFAQTTLVFHKWLPESHFLHEKAFYPWAADVAKVTEGRVKIEFTAAALGSPVRQYDMAGEGVVDIAWGPQGIVPGRFPHYEFVYLPFLGSTGEALSVAFWRVYEKHLKAVEEERETRTKVLSVHGATPGHIFGNAKPLNSLDDLKGAKLRVSSATVASIAEGLGMVPVAAPATKVYELLSSGVVDANAFDSLAQWNFNLADFTKTSFQVPGGLVITPFYLIINKNKWDSISAEDQAAIEEISGESFAALAGREWDVADAEAERHLVENGMKIVKISPNELELAKQNLDSVRKAWLAKAQEAGIDGEAVIEMYVAEQAKYLEN